MAIAHQRLRRTAGDTTCSTLSLPETRFCRFFLVKREKWLDLRHFAKIAACYLHALSMLLGGYLDAPGAILDAPCSRRRRASTARHRSTRTGVATRLHPPR